MYTIILFIIGLAFIGGLAIFLYKKVLDSKEIIEDDEDEDFIDFTKE